MQQSTDRPMRSMLCLLGLLCGTVALASAANPAYFGIHVVDKDTGRGVPRVKLTTTTNEVFITDSAGWAAVIALG
jgi:hypothetical protein